MRVVMLVTTCDGAGTKVMITNLHQDTEPQDLRTVFEADSIFPNRKDGDIKSCDIHLDESGASKCTGEVVFRRRADALEAIKELDGTERCQAPPSLSARLSHDVSRGRSPCRS